MVAQIHLPENERKLDPREALSVRFAEKMALDFRSVDTDFKIELRRHFSDEEIAELAMMIGQYLALGRLLVISGAHQGASEIYVPNY